MTIYSSGRHGGADDFVAEDIDGPSLKRLLDIRRSKNEPLPLCCAFWMLDQVCTGLAEVHAAGVVHHDVKPGNLMIEAGTGRVLLIEGDQLARREGAAHRQGRLPPRREESVCLGQQEQQS